MTKLLPNLKLLVKTYLTMLKSTESSKADLKWSKLKKTKDNLKEFLTEPDITLEILIKTLHMLKVTSIDA